MQISFLFITVAPTLARSELTLTSFLILVQFDSYSVCIKRTNYVEINDVISHKTVINIFDRRPDIDKLLPVQKSDLLDHT